MLADDHSGVGVGGQRAFSHPGYPSDLVALPALGFAWWAWRRVAAAPPLPDGLAFRSRVILAVPITVLAITATSAPGDTTPSVDSVRGPGEGETGAQVVIEVNGQ